MSNGISKSASRRRKRKEKEQLKPKLQELLESLPTNTTATTETEKSKVPEKYVAATKTVQNQPNAAKRTGHHKILQQEHQTFNAVLQNPQFRQSPFEALKAAIASKTSH